jgi:hypothetical protein
MTPEAALIVSRTIAYLYSRRARTSSHTPLKMPHKGLFVCMNVPEVLNEKRLQLLMNSRILNDIETLRKRF